MVLFFVNGITNYTHLTNYGFIMYTQSQDTPYMYTAHVASESVTSNIVILIV